MSEDRRRQKEGRRRRGRGAGGHDRAAGPAWLRGNFHEAGGRAGRVSLGALQHHFPTGRTHGGVDAVVTDRLADEFVSAIPRDGDELERISLARSTVSSWSSGPDLRRRAGNFTWRPGRVLREPIRRLHLEDEPLPGECDRSHARVEDQPGFDAWLLMSVRRFAAWRSRPWASPRSKTNGSCSAQLLDSATELLRQNPPDPAGKPVPPCPPRQLPGQGFSAVGSLASSGRAARPSGHGSRPGGPRG